MTKTFIQKQREQEETLFSITNAIRHILNMKDDVKEIHRKKLLTLMLWFYTEADGLTALKTTNYKYKITYISEETFKKRELVGEDHSEYKKGLRHEHVYTRDSLIRELLSEPTKMNSILERAVGCVVTKDEDFRLRQVDKTKTCNGWERYRKANINVYKRIRDQFGNEKFESYKI